MLEMDPRSPRQAGVDANGEPVRLGEISSTGNFVGYISADGVDWESREEHDVTLGAGALLDAFIVWRRTGGMIPSHLDLDGILDSCHILPENRTKALMAFQSQVTMTCWPSELEVAMQAVFN